MSRINRNSLMAPRNCFNRSSEKKKTLLEWCTALPASRSGLASNWNSFSRWTGLREEPDVVSHDADRWAVHLLQRGGAERRADAAAPPRTALFVADVRAPLRPAFRSLSPGRARLPGLRAQRLAGPEDICLHVRPLRRDHESLRRSGRALALHAVHAGLRRPRGVSHGARPSGADRGAH